MVGEEPLREERWRLLVLALYRSQRQADALGALRRARATLAEQLGVDPGPALRELEAEVLAQSPSLVMPRQRTGSEVVPSTTPPREQDALVERDRELAALTEALDQLAEGRHGLLLIEGPAGIGKTRLLGRGPEAGRRSIGARAVGAGQQLESAFAFGIVRQLFEPDDNGPAVIARSCWVVPRPAHAGSSTWPTVATPTASPHCTGCTGWRSTSPQRAR